MKLFLYCVQLPMCTLAFLSAVAKGGQESVKQGQEAFRLKAIFAIDQLLGQMDRAAELYPDLRKGIETTKSQFETNALNEGRKAFVSKLETSNPTAWKDYLAQTAKTLESGKHAAMTLGEARIRWGQFHQMIQHKPCVPAKTRGEITVQGALLASNPRYIDNPLLEFDEGWTLPHEIPVSTKSNLVLHIPASWTSTGGGKSTGYFVSDLGFGMTSIGILSLEAPASSGPPFQEEETQRALPPGTTITNTALGKLAGLPAQIIKCKGLAGNGYLVMAIKYTFQVDSNLVAVTFLVNGTSPNWEELEALQKKYEPLFNAIAAKATLGSSEMEKKKD